MTAFPNGAHLGRELEWIKRQTGLVALVQAAGVELRRHDANVIGRFPWARAKAVGARSIG